VEGRRGDALAVASRHLLDFWLREVATTENAAAKDALVETGAKAFLDFLAREMNDDGFPKADTARANAPRASRTARTRHSRAIPGRVRRAAGWVSEWCTSVVLIRVQIQKVLC
jgi:hypothetical protein